MVAEDCSSHSGGGPGPDDALTVEWSALVFQDMQVCHVDRFALHNNDLHIDIWRIIMIDYVVT